jgi:serine/threonine-protein kinase RsbW
VDIRKLCLDAELSNLAQIRRFVESVSAISTVNQDALDDMVLAVDEAATNIIVHGYQKQGGKIEIDLYFQGDALHVILYDDAPDFDPTCAPIPDINIPLSERPLGGMGIHLIRSYVDEIRHSITPEGGNMLLLVKNGVLSR